MPNFGYLRGFDPWFGRLPAITDFGFGYVAREARHLLAGRPASEIVFAHSFLQSILIQADSEFGIHLISQTQPSGSSRYPDAVCLLIDWVRERTELDERPEFPNAHWSDYYAVLALSLIAQATISEEDPHPGTELGSPEHERRQKRFAAALYSDVAELIASARILREYEARLVADTQARLEMTLSERGRRARAHSKTGMAELKQDAVNFYLSSDRQNKSKIARAFLKSQPTERQKLLTETRGIRTICEWFRAAEKAEIKNQKK